MELKTKYFHSVHSYKYEYDENGICYDYGDDKVRQKQLQDILYKFDCILKSGYILPYKDIEKQYEGINRNMGARFNGKDMISISLHEDNPDDMDLKYKEDREGDYEDAFQSFVFQEPSIVLSEDIKNLKHINYPMIYLERLFREPISLEYMDAISVTPGRLWPFFESVPKIKYEKYATQRRFRYVDLEFLDNLRGLLDKYGYDVPFVNLSTGHEFHENEEYRKVLQKVGR